MGSYFGGVAVDKSVITGPYPSSYHSKQGTANANEASFVTAEDAMRRARRTRGDC
jgi:hypothetical protein